MRQGYVMLSWLFSIFIDGYMKEMKDKSGNVSGRQKMNGMGWAVVACLFAESKEELQRVVDEIYNVCTRRKLKVNRVKSKVMVFEKREVKVVD